MGDKGQYYLNTKKRFKEAMGEEGTPSLSPSPDRQIKKKKKRASSEEPETEEMKGLRKLRDIQNLKVDGDGMVKEVVPDSKDYEYDSVTRMYKKKGNVIEEERKKQGYADL